MKVSVILPTYNEKGNIVELIETIHMELEKYDHEIMLVDDNSPDGTYQAVVDKNYPYVKTILRKEDKGFAKSIRCGLENASGDIFVIMDSDFNHQPKYLPFMIQSLSHYDCVSASRFLYGGRMSTPARHLLSWCFNIFVRSMTNGTITDSLYGFLAIKKDVIEKCDYDKIFWGYGDYCIRLLCYLQKHKTKILQVPTVNGDRKAGIGNSAFLKLFWQYFTETIKLSYKVRVRREMYKELKRCRICGNTDLVSVLNLGKQALTGVFPKTKYQKITTGPLELVKCQETVEGNSCGLLQLGHSYDLDEMYGDNYGYRSGLNQLMVKHLKEKVKKITNLVSIKPEDMVIDIGSNDGTLLGLYPNNGAVFVGIDPTGEKFKEYYAKHVKLIPDFFSEDCVKQKFGDKKAKIITSISMFYDLEEPMKFMKEVNEVLDDNGIWVFEQSYMPTMLKMNAYDTVCHEHLEYYSLKQIKWMTDRVGLKIIDVEFNDINGGSFSVTVAKENSSYKENKTLINRILGEEKGEGLESLMPYEDFRNRVYDHRDKLRKFIHKAKKENKKIVGYGASTKGNVVLQFCNLTQKDMPCIAEVNEDKFGCYTPGTHIPIISEEKAKLMHPDYLLVLPWHFKESFIKREKEYMEKGGMLVMPLPDINISKKINSLEDNHG